MNLVNISFIQKKNIDNFTIINVVLITITSKAYYFNDSMASKF